MEIGTRRDALEPLENLKSTWQQPISMPISAQLIIVQIEVSSGKLLKNFPHEVHVNYASMSNWDE